MKVNLKMFQYLFQTELCIKIFFVKSLCSNAIPKNDFIQFYSILKRDPKPGHRLGNTPALEKRPHKIEHNKKCRPSDVPALYDCGWGWKMFKDTYGCPFVLENHLTCFHQQEFNFFNVTCMPVTRCVLM